MTSTEHPLVLSIDIGTSSTRVLLWDTRGREIDKVHAQVQYQMRTTHDGGMEIEPEELLKHVGECIDDGLSQAKDHAGAIQAVGISTFWHAVMGADASGKPVTPIYNWADDRSAAVARRLRSELDAESIHSRTGCVVHPSYYPAKLVWLRETAPDLYRRSKRWISPSEYMFGRLFGKDAIRVSTSMASATGLFNQEEQRWDTETLKLLDLDEERLSEIVDLSHCSNGLTSSFASRWPALKEVPFYPAVGDGACGSIGSGCVTPNRLAINLGTSGAIRVVWSEIQDQREPSHSHTLPQSPSVPPGLWRYRVDSHRPILGAAFSDGGLEYAWMSRTLQLPPPEELEKQIAEMTPGAHGLTFLPFLAGERSMGWNPDARASLVGMNLDTNPVEIVRAAMEAVALQFARAAIRLRTLFPHANRIVGSGGALGHSPAWCKMFADAIGSPVELLPRSRKPAAAVRHCFQWKPPGLFPSTAHAEALTGKTIEPDAKAHALYLEIAEKNQRVYEATGALGASQSSFNSIPTTPESVV